MFYYSTFKVKIGKDLKRDIEKVNLIGGLSKGKAKIRLDANQGYSLEEALVFVREVNPANIELLEQPLPRENWEEMKKLSQESPLLLMLDESNPVRSEDVARERSFSTTVDDIAHWAGMSPEKCREVLNHFASQRRVDIYTDRIVVQNINDFARFVSSRRGQQKE